MRHLVFPQTSIKHLRRSRTDPRSVLFSQEVQLLGGAEVRMGLGVQQGTNLRLAFSPRLLPPCFGSASPCACQSGRCAQALPQCGLTNSWSSATLPTTGAGRTRATTAAGTWRRCHQRRAARPSGTLRWTPGVSRWPLPQPLRPRTRSASACSASSALRFPRSARATFAARTEA